MSGGPQRRELGALLRARREQIVRAERGLPPVGRSRTTGLRREEVAFLSGVSVTWYTWLEQGRDIQPSRQVLSALARPLGLSAAEHAYVLSLVGATHPGRPHPSRRHPTRFPPIGQLPAHPQSIVTGTTHTKNRWHPRHLPLLGCHSSRKWRSLVALSGVVWSNRWRMPPASRPSPLRRLPLSAAFEHSFVICAR